MSPSHELIRPEDRALTSQTEDRTAKVRVLGSETLVRVPITSSAKPEISPDFETKWQKVVTLAARIIKVPAGLLMRLHEKNIEVFVSSETEDNPYDEKERSDLGLGFYCETVVGNRKELLVPHALEDPAWEKNPDVELNMFSYLGVPVCWPDGEVFGTFCVLDNKRNEYNEDQRQLVHRLAEVIESDLANIMQMNERLLQAELHAQEIRHRIKNQFNTLISYIDLHSNSATGPIDHAGLNLSLRAKIETLAKLHQEMSRQNTTAKVPLLSFLREISSLMVSSAPFDIGVISTGEDVLVDEKAVVTIASLLNELVTNSIKYAFHETDDPTVRIGVFAQDDGIQIEYSDNGAEQEAEARNDGGLGSLIVAGLADQLSARVEQSGFNYSIHIPQEALEQVT